MIDGDAELVIQGLFPFQKEQAGQRRPIKLGDEQCDTIRRDENVVEVFKECQWLGKESIFGLADVAMHLVQQSHIVHAFSFPHHQTGAAFVRGFSGGTDGTAARCRGGSRATRITSSSPR